MSGLSEGLGLTKVLPWAENCRDLFHCIRLALVSWGERYCLDPYLGVGNAPGFMVG